MTASGEPFPVTRRFGADDGFSVCAGWLNHDPARRGLRAPPVSPRDRRAALHPVF